MSQSFGANQLTTLESRLFQKGIVASEKRSSRKVAKIRKAASSTLISLNLLSNVLTRSAGKALTSYFS
jgi:hypothetical protein